VWIQGNRLEVRASEQARPLRLRLHYTHCRAPFVSLTEDSPLLEYPLERARGYAHTARLISPGYFECSLGTGHTLALAASTEGWEAVDRDPLTAFALERQREDRLLDRAPREMRSGSVGRLFLAADQFLIEPVGRPADLAWARATGQDARTVVAGYHWFADWGRDTMISLEGLTLCTRRYEEASAILRTFAHYVRDGLIPNRFPERGQKGLYFTADGTLWFFHALDRYLAVTGDEELLWDLLPTLEDILVHHRRGTRFGIGVDPEDGLLCQGTPEHPLTWMDAKVGDWIVTPRRGKAVELSALWYNALRLVADWHERFGEEGEPAREEAQRVRESFNRRFWNAETQCLYDVVDGEHGDDPAVRPNQLLSLSLRHPVLDPSRWAPVLRAVEEALLTPRGLRTLAPGDPAFHPTYDGDVRARDAAYHQGTVWPWLLGPFLDAWTQAHGWTEPPRTLLHGLESYLEERGVGQVSEIFDAEPPFLSRGCIAQAWSVAETLRALLRLLRTGP
jgi:predicted glycogen debranching enzyme